MFATQGYWDNIPDHVKPNTKDLLTLLMKSKADSTVKRYTKEIVKFSRWCNLSSIQPTPPFSVSIVIAYLHKVYVSSKSYAALSLTHAALKWFHSFIPGIISNPLDAAICHNLLEAAKRSKPVVSKKEPISADIIKKIIDKYAGPSANLKDLRLTCMCSLGFAGFFRYDEFSSILLNHLEFLPDHLCVFVPRAKNDVYREGNKVYIKRLLSKYCPVALLERYILMAEVDLDSNLPLFRPLRLFKSSNTYKLYGSKLSYTRCREIFKNCLKDLGLDYKLYGLHSLRSGGATSVVSNSTSLSERLLKLHGRWKSDCAKDMYVLEDVSKRLAITDNLGL